MFYYRHQAGGVLTQHPFPSMPTDEELGPLRKLMLDTFGNEHPKTGAPFWDRVEEVLAELDSHGNAKVIAHGHVPAISGNPRELTDEERAEEGGFPLINLRGGGRGLVRNP